MTGTNNMRRPEKVRYEDHRISRHRRTKGRLAFYVPCQMSGATNTVLIAVDGGGTGCRVAVGTAENGVMAEAKGGPANVSNDFEQSIRNITRTVEEALEKAGFGHVDLALITAHLGLSGADLKTMRNKTAAALPYGRLCISGDRETSVAGILEQSDGYVVALGTGTIIARQQSGVVKTVGGWGFQISDQASGAWLGRMLLVRTLMAGEALVPHSTLSREILDHLSGIQGLYSFSTTATPSDFAKFAPDVFAAGAQGDAIALQILQEGATYLEQGLTALGYETGNILSLAGGVGPHFEPYLGADFVENICAPKGNALQGAFQLARQLAASPAR